jgi:phage protein D
VFGQVVSGIEVIRQIAKVPTDLYEHPRIPVHIFDCGELDTITGKPMMPGQSVEESASLVKGTVAVALFEKHSKRAKESESEAASEDEEEDSASEEKQPSEVKDKIALKRLELQMKMNEARKLNNRAVLEEQERLNDTGYEKRKAKEELWKEKR